MNEDFYTLVNYVEQVSDQSGGWLIQLLKRFGNEYTFYVFRNKKTVGELIKYLDEHCSFFKLEYLDQKPLENIIDKVLPEFSWQANPFIGVNFKELEFAD